jgi:hypothetical protein
MEASAVVASTSAAAAEVASTSASASFALPGITDKIANLVLDKNEELEILIECPICFNVPKGHIFNCSKGHSVCSDCYSKMSQCGTCFVDYTKKSSKSRNYALETIANHFRSGKVGTKPDELMKLLRSKELQQMTQASESQQQRPKSSPRNKWTSCFGERRSTKDVCEPEFYDCPYKLDGCNEMICVQNPGNEMVKAVAKHVRICPYR